MVTEQPRVPTDPGLSARDRLRLSSVEVRPRSAAGCSCSCRLVLRAFLEARSGRFAGPRRSRAFSTGSAFLHTDADPILDVSYLPVPGRWRHGNGGTCSTPARRRSSRRWRDTHWSRSGVPGGRVPGSMEPSLDPPNCAADRLHPENRRKDGAYGASRADALVTVTGAARGFAPPGSPGSEEQAHPDPERHSRLDCTDDA